MVDRSQSNVVGVILLVSVVTLTVTASGAVILSDWEANIGDGPTADIDSDITPINISVEHRGGETLDPDRTTIELIGSDKTISLDESLEPGGSVAWEFDRLDNLVELVIVDEPTETVVHRNRHNIHNDIVGLELLIAGETTPVYLLESQSTNYTVDLEYELGVSDPVTDRANISIETGPLALDENASIVETQTTGDGSIAADFDGFETETEIRVLKDPQEPDIATIGTEKINGTAITATGELLDLDELPDVDRFFEYVPVRGFTDDEDDSVVASGELSDDPAGYDHAGGWTHDNKPIEPGETRIYVFKQSGGAEYYWALRDEIQTDDGDDWRDLNNDVHETRQDGDVPDGTYRAEITRSDDGSTAEVIFYDDLEDGEITRTYDDLDLGLDAADGLYFSNYQWQGTDLWLIDIIVSSDTEQTDKNSVERDDVTLPYVFDQTVDGLRFDQTYRYRVSAERKIGDTTVTETSDWRAVDLLSPVVETVSADPDAGDATEAVVVGELEAIGDFTKVDVGFSYIPYRAFSENPDENDDGVIATGEFVSDPRGYAHEGGWIHDNNEIEAGETRTYEFDSRGASAEVYWALRDGLQLNDGGDTNDINNITELRPSDNTDVPDGQYRIEVTRSDDGTNATVAVYDSVSGSAVVSTREGVDLDPAEPLYFSNYQWQGTSDTAGSLRLIDIYTSDDEKRIVVDEATENPQQFDTKLSDLKESSGYGVAAFGQTEVDGETVVRSGEEQRFETGDSG